MRSARLACWLFLLVALPTAVLVWLGARMLQAETHVADTRVRQLYEARLREQERRIQAFVQGREQKILELLVDAETPERFRALSRHPLVHGAFLLGADGRLQRPAAGAGSSRSEAAFAARLQPLLDRGALVFEQQESRRRSAPTMRSGWVPWFREDGLGLVFRAGLPDGRIVGVELNRSRFLADLVSVLPDSSEADPGFAAELCGVRGQRLYQWGGYGIEADSSPRAVLAAAAPLASWQWRAYAPDDALPVPVAGVRNVQLAFGIAAVALALAGIAFVIHREIRRSAAEAATRVSFVNRVSHELKTPLTNIRMYAELLEETLEPGEETTTEYAGVIVRESRRLSRLINNVLSFSRKQRSSLSIHPKPTDIDELIGRMLDETRDDLGHLGIELHAELGFKGTAEVDPDALEQILLNLLSNVEKYALGGELRVETRRDLDMLLVIVHDSGPGVPRELRASVFAPFRRASERVNEGVSGTGIGLTIARELARLHGGDLVLAESAKGARFELTLPVCPAIHPTTSGTGL